jgi:nitric oxide reductase activation protein
MEAEAASAIDSGIKRETKPDALGHKLHVPMSNLKPNSLGRVPQQYHVQGDTLETTNVRIPPPITPEQKEVLKRQRPGHKAIAKKMAKRLAAIREQVKQRTRYQDEGRLDRRRMVAAVKGERDIRFQERKHPQTSFAASIALDLSGSMERNVENGRLYDSTMVMADTFEELDIPYEVRGFGDSSAMFKSMGDPTAEIDRVGNLAGTVMGGTNMHTTSCLATTSLQACEQKNRLFISLTDGNLDDHDETVAQMKYARKQGIVTYGVFLETSRRHPPDKEKMDEIYGPGNWAHITDLKQFPDVVGKRLGILFNKIK